MDIIIAEDSRSVAFLLRDILESSGYRVIVAKDGLEAWHLFRRYRSRVIVSDWQMPKMNGLDLECRLE